MVDAALVPLVLILAVAAGLVTVAVSASRVQAHQTALSRWFLANVLLFNLLILLGLAFHVARSQLPGESGPLWGVFLLALVALMAPLKLGWLYAFVAMNRALLGAELPRGWGGRIRMLGGGLVAIYGALLVLGATGGRSRLLQTTVSVFDVLVVGGAIVSAGWLVAAAAVVGAPARRRALMVFGGLHVLTLVAFVGSFAASGDQHELVTGVLLIVYNLVPLAWTLRFQPGGPNALEEGGNRYGLTARERQIIELIGAGKTNQEIADGLFISLATVKDHNHNIFRKTGVRNRLELANLFRNGS